MGFFFGCCTGGGSSGGALLGSRLAYASPAGSVAAAPAGFSSSVGRLEVTLPSGGATWTSLTLGADGQLLEIRNNDSTNTLILPKADWGGVGDLNLPPGNAVLAYCDLTVGAWQVTS